MGGRRVKGQGRGGGGGYEVETVEGVARCEREREEEETEKDDSNGASGHAGVGEHSGVNRVQPQLGSLQPGSLRFTRGARSRVFGCENGRCRDRPSANPEAARWFLRARSFAVVIFFRPRSARDDLSKLCVHVDVDGRGAVVLARPPDYRLSFFRCLFAIPLDPSRSRVHSTHDRRPYTVHDSR